VLKRNHLMNRDGIAFLHRWLQQNLTDADRGGNSIRAMVLADKCRHAAAAEGLSIDDEPKWGSIESMIYSRMQSPKSAEIIFPKVWATMPKAPRLH
jgi:hypothetical protein